ncbi:MAG: hypothetical protein JWN60_966 [Acidobacteria bacterium]|nr:hypothetical protein [Acidobacteriota bacterium]
MINFCKNANCPSAQDLLRFQTTEISQRERRNIESHFAECEFCAAEAEFYKHYPQSEEKIEAVEIPKPLYELAKALLGNRRNDFSMLNRLLGENETLTLEKV